MLQKKIISFLILLAVFFPLKSSFAQLLSNCIIGNGSVELTGSHAVSGTIGQPVVGTSGNAISGGFWNEVNAGAYFPTGVEDNNIIPVEYALFQNYPNPFNPSTIIKYDLPFPGQVSIKIYSLLGSEVASLIDEYKPAGSYRIEWKPAGLASGVYFYIIKAKADEQNKSFTAVKKMILLK